MDLMLLGIAKNTGLHTGNIPDKEKLQDLLKSFALTLVYS